MGRISNERANRIYYEAKQLKASMTEEDKAKRKEAQRYAPPEPSNKSTKTTSSASTSSPKANAKYVPMDTADNQYAQALAAFNPGGTFVPRAAQEEIAARKAANHSRYMDALDTSTRAGVAAAGSGTVRPVMNTDETVAVRNEWAKKAAQYEADRQSAGREFRSARGTDEYRDRVGSFDRSAIPYGANNTGRIRYALDDSFRNELDTFNQRQGLLDSTYENLKYLNDFEKNDLANFVAQGDYERANKYLDHLQPELNARMQGNVSAANKKLAEEQPVAGVLANIVGTREAGMALLPTIQGAINEEMGVYKPVDTNGSAFRAAHLLRDTEEGIGNAAYNAAGGGTKGEIARTLAQAGLSAAQNASMLPMGGTAPLVFMGSMAAGQSALDTLESGGTAQDALKVAAATGIIETATEKIGIDNFFRISRLGSKGIKDFLKGAKQYKLLANDIGTFSKALGSQMAAEGVEEMIAEVAENLADTAIRGDNGQYAQLVQTYMANGMSEEQAKARAFTDMYIDNVAKAGITGALAGGMLGVGGATIGTFQTSTRNRELIRNFEDVGNELQNLKITPEQLISAVQQSGSKDAQDFARELSQKLALGEEVTTAEMGRLHLLSNNYITSKDYEAVQKAAIAEEEAARNAGGNVRENEQNLRGSEAAAGVQQNAGNAAGVQQGETRENETVKPENETKRETNETKRETGAENVASKATNNTESIKSTVGQVTGETPSVQAPQTTETAPKEARQATTYEQGAQVQTPQGEGTVVMAADNTVAVRLANGTTEIFKTSDLSSAQANANENTALPQSASAQAATGNAAANAETNEANAERQSKTAAQSKTVAETSWENIQKIVQTKAKGGLSQKDEYTMNSAGRRAFDRIGRALGVEIHFVDRIVNEEGESNGLYQNGHIFISRDAENPYHVVLAHEITHHFEKTAPEVYEKFKGAALKMNPGLVEKYMAMWGYDEAVAEFEVAADFAGELLEKEGTVKRVIKEDISAARGFHRAMNALFDKVRGDETKGLTEEERKLDAQLDAARDMWRRCLRETRGEKAEGGESKGQMSRKTSPEQNIDDAAKKAGYVRVGDWYAYTRPRTDKDRKGNEYSRYPINITERRGNPRVMIGDNNAVVIENWPGFSDEQGFLLAKLSQALYDKFLPSRNYFIRATNNAKEIDLAASGKLKPSYNYRDKYAERGVSAADHFGYAQNGEYKYAYKIRGTVLGKGTDGEVLLDPKTVEVVGGLMTREDVAAEAEKEHGRIENNLAKAGWSMPAFIALTSELRSNIYTRDALTAEDLEKEIGSKESKQNAPQMSRKLTPEQRKLDEDYMAAVERGDMETAQRMVDEAAKQAMPGTKAVDKNGKLLRAYHGTKEQFTAFLRDEIGSLGRFEGSGFNFTPSEGRAKNYGGNVLSVYLDISKPLNAQKKTITVPQLAQIIRQADPTGDNIIANYASSVNDYGTERFVARESLLVARSIWDFCENDVDIYSALSVANIDAEGLIETFEKLGYDGAIHYDGYGEIKTLIAFSSNQIKSADPVTYDDDGNVIPLSERFNEKKDDIRFSRKVSPEITKADVEVLRGIGRKSVNDFTNSDIKKSEPWARKFYKELGVKSPFFRAWFGDWRANDTAAVNIVPVKAISKAAAGKAENADIGKTISWGNQVVGETRIHQRSGGIATDIVGNIGEIVKSAVYLNTVVSMPDSKSKMPNTAFMHHFYTLVKYDGNLHLLKLYVEEALNNKETEVFARAYELKDIEEVAFATNGVLSQKGGLTGATNTTSTYKVADLFALVKKYDPDFKPKPASAVVNEDGTPKVVYHGTLAKGLHEFNKDFIGSRYAADEVGFFFISRKSVAQDYAVSEFNSNTKGEVISAYLDMKKPLVFNGQYARANGYGNIFRDNDVVDVWDNFQGAILEEIEGQDYDGIILDDGTDQMYIAFEPTQIKSATDNVGTFDRSNPDIRRSRKGQDAAMRRANRLARENARLKGQFKLTKGVKLRESDIRKVTRELLKEYEIIDFDKDELEGHIRAMAEAAQAANESNADKTWDSIRNVARGLSRYVGRAAFARYADVDEEYDADYVRETYEGIRQHLGRQRVLSPWFKDPWVENESPQRKEMRDYYRRKLFGALTLTSDRSVDKGPLGDIGKLYEGLTETFGEAYFPSDVTNDEDQIMHIADVLDALKDTLTMIGERTPVTVGEDVEQSSRDETRRAAYEDEVYGKFYAALLLRIAEIRAEKPTFADKEKAKRDALKDKHKSRVQSLKAEIRQNKTEAQEALREAKAQKREALQELKDKYKAKTAEARERQNARELRRKIEKHTKDLYKTLAKPTNEKHINEDVRPAAALLISLINQESNFETDPATGKRVSRGGATRKAQLAGVGLDIDLPNILTKRTEAARKMRKAAEQIFAGEDNYLLIYDPELMENLAIMEDWSDKPLATMSSAELQVVWDAVRGVKHMITQSRWEIGTLASGLVRDVDLNNPRRTIKYGAAASVDKLLNIDQLTPQAFFHRFGEGGDRLFRMLRRSQDKYVRIIADIQARTAEVIKDIDIDKLNKDIATYKVKGGDVTLSRAQVLLLYASIKREQAAGHILGGGIKAKPLKGKGLFETKQLLPVEVTQEDLDNMFKEAKLTEAEKKAADGLVNIMSTVLAEYGNEASLRTYGYAKFREGWYVPIETDPTSNKTDNNDPLFKQFTAAASIAGRGFAKQTKEGAKNAIMVGSLFDVYAKHVNDMAMYAAYVETLENMRRIRNFKFKDGTKTQNYIEALLTKSGVAYWDKLIRDINGGERLKNDDFSFDRFVGAYKAAAVSANIRVILQQPTAIIRAAAEINPAYLIAAMRKIPKRHEWERIKNNVGIAQWKDWGYFDINTGRQMRDVVLGTDSLFEKFKQAGMRPMSDADSFAWTLLYHACEDEAKAKGLRPGGAAFDSFVASRFGDIIDKTQVVDGVLQRSQIMRSTDAVTKMATSFMAEPTKTYNMFLSAVWDWRHAKSKTAKQAARKKLGFTVAALVVSFLVNAAAQSLIDALRDDDRDKEFLDKFWDAYLGRPEEDDKNKAVTVMGGNLWTAFNPVTYIPFFKDIVSLVQGFDTKRMDMESIGRVIDAAEQALAAARGEGKQTAFARALALASEVSRVFGLPLANIKRDSVAVLNTIAQEKKDYGMMYNVDRAFYKLDKNVSRYVDIMLKAHDSGDTETERRITDDLHAAGVDDKKIKSAADTIRKKQEGVDSTTDLKDRYRPYDEAAKYNKLESYAKGTSAYRQANTTERSKYERMLEDALANNDTAQGRHEKAQELGVSDNQYMEFLIAQDVANRQRNDGTGKNEGKPGGVSKNDYIAALDMTSMTRTQKSAAFDKKYKKGNPYN